MVLLEMLPRLFAGSGDVVVPLLSRVRGTKGSTSVRKPGRDHQTGHSVSVSSRGLHRVTKQRVPLAAGGDPPFPAPLDGKLLRRHPELLP